MTFKVLIKKITFIGSAIAIVLFVIMGLLSHSIYKKNKMNHEARINTERKQQEIRHKLNIEEQKRQKNKQQQTLLFNEKREVILMQITNLINEGNHDEAKKILKMFNLVDDAGIENIKNKLKEIELNNLAKKTDVKNLKLNRDIYLSLSEINPNNEMYKNKLGYFQKKIYEVNQIAKSKARIKKKLAEAEKEKELVFSSARGACYLAIKSYLHDPSSAEVIGYMSSWHTKLNQDGTVFVQPQLRAKNMYGALIKSVWNCNARIDGDKASITSLKQISP
jgi:hypothetical protein